MVKRLNVCIITPPRGEAAFIPFSNMVKILSPFTNTIHIISGGALQILGRSKYLQNKLIYSNIKYNSYKNTIKKMIQYMSLQIIYSINILHLFKKIDVWIFFLDGECLLLPFLTAKLSRRKVIILLTASTIRSSITNRDYLMMLISRFQSISFKLSDSIIIYSDSLISDWKLDKYKHKINIAHEHFINFEEFKLNKKIVKRNNKIGYIGRLSVEKGIINFMESISLLFDSPYQFIIGGDGPLKNKIEKRYNTKNSKINFLGWIPHKELSVYLNELRLIVIPSFTEGLPNIMLEAMACGTPVLATAVGAIPDIIKDNETGFLLASNDPTYMAKSISIILNNPENLENISINAYNYVKKNFNYKTTIDLWFNVFNKLGLL